MNKLAIVDIDGVIANNTARFAKAEEARHNAMPDKLEDALSLTVAQEKELTNLYWQTAFTPELVSLDTLIPEANKHIAILEKARYRAVFLTSRPEAMREATTDWMYKNFIMVSPYLDHYHSKVPYELIMKAPAFQYTKTTTWKAGMVQTLASLYGASEVVFIDDETANHDTILAYEGNYALTGYHSLQEAVNALAE